MLLANSFHKTIMIALPPYFDSRVNHYNLHRLKHLYG